MNQDPPETSKRPPLPIVVATNVLMLGFFVLSASQVVHAFVTGRTKFPAKYNDMNVTLSDSPGWFTASVVAWLLFSAFFAHVFQRCLRTLLKLLRS